MNDNAAAQIDLFISRALSPQAQSAALAAAAKAGLAELQSSGAAPQNYTREVDGVKGAREEAVKPGGVITYRFADLGAAVQIALDELQRLSPGVEYRDSFALLIGARFIRAESFRPERLAGLRKVILFNRRPYSRQVDVRMIGPRSMRFSDGGRGADLFRQAGTAVDNSQHGNSIKTYRVYKVVFPGIYILLGGPRRGKPVESPGLVLEVR